MNRERLSRAADTLAALPLSPMVRFDMCHWWKLPRGRDECGTQGCAAGYLANDPWFQSQGLHMYGEGVNKPIYDGYTGCRGLAMFFDISLHQSTWLFDPNRYTVMAGPEAREAVVMRIRSLLDEKSSFFLMG